MRIAVIGAGVVGVSTAYLLSKDGHAVTLIDAASKPGQGASAGNAAQLSWAYGDALASPSLLKHLPDIVAGRDPAFRVRVRLDPDFLLWGLRFLSQTSDRRWWENTTAILNLADESRREMAALLSEAELCFDYRVAGKLHLYPDAASFSAAAPLVERKRRLGLEQRLLPRAEAEAVEPALRYYRGEIAGAVYTPGDALGDAAAFSRDLTRFAAIHYGLETIFGVMVTGFERHKGRVTAISFADRNALAVDAAVVTAGPLIRTLRRDLPEASLVQPVRGYSLTVPWRDGAPRVSLTDVKRKLAFAAIGDRFRVAGLADIERPGAGFDPVRFEVLKDQADGLLPGHFHVGEGVVAWSGERPTTPSSQPIIAPSLRAKGIYINAGHGMLGWTLAMGSARRLVNMLAS